MYIAFASDDSFCVASTLTECSRTQPLLRLQWQDDGSFFCADERSVSMVVSSESDQLMAGGIARLQHPGCNPRSRPGIQADLTSAVFATDPTASRADEISGVFSFVVRDRRARVMRAHRDPSGIATCYWSLKNDGVLFSDSLNALASTHQIDSAFVAAFIATGMAGSQRTPWKGVRQVPAGGMVEWRAGRPVIHFSEGWRARPVSDPESEAEAVAECRRLMIEGVRSDLGVGETAWADLSGGHDSSSVAAIGAWLSQGDSTAKLAGSVTFVDSIGNGDESAFADQVTRTYGLKSVKIFDPTPWEDDGTLPPITELPVRDYPYWLRDKTVSEQLLAQGGRCLLSGIGPDFYLPLTPAYAVDLIAAGRVQESLEVLRDWTLQSRNKWWRVAAQELVVPLMPQWAQASLLSAREARPQWLRSKFADRTSFDRLQSLRNVVHGWPGSVCGERVAQRLSETGASLPGWRSSPGIEMRHPLLYAPLVRFCMALPRRLRTNYFHPKPVLRMAMEGIVPREILERHTKGSLILPRVCWAFRKHRDKLVRTIRGSVLADLGVIEPRQFVQEMDACARGTGRSARQVYFALSLETWLSVRFNGGRTLIG